MHRFLPLNGDSGHTALVDSEDFDRISEYKWYPLYSKSGRVYARALAPNSTKTILLHRLVLNAPVGALVDHRNRRETLDCRKSNLRLATYPQNIANRGSLRNGYKGVFRDKGRIRAAIQFAGSKKYLGYFRTEEAAARAYDREAIALYGDYAYLNFPPPPPAPANNLAA